MRRGPSSKPTQARPERQPPNFLTCSFVLQPEDVCGRERERPGLGRGDTFKEGTCSPSHSQTTYSPPQETRTAGQRPNPPGGPGKAGWGMGRGEGGQNVGR